RSAHAHSLLQHGEWRALPGAASLAGLATGSVALGLGHQFEAPALALALAFAGGLGGHAGVLALAAIDAETLPFSRLGILHRLCRQGVEEGGCHKGEGGTGDGAGFCRHGDDLSWWYRGRPCVARSGEA